MSEDPLLGRELEHYRLDRVLGQGGMGVVYAGTDLALDRTVAVKVLPPHLLNDQTARVRFQSEIKSAAAIEHPHVVPVYAAGFDDGHFFLVMRMIHGPDLSRELTANGNVNETRALRLVGQLASALHAVHGQQLVHRDVKPQNILLGACGDTDEYAALTDFGIAKALTDSSGLTGIGPIGTPNYMAPEVCRGGQATPASDQYALAVVSYEMLAGRPPFIPGEGDVLEAHISREPEPLQRRCPSVSDAVAAAVHRGMAKRPQDRFPDVRELASVDVRSSTSFDQAEELTQVLTAAQPAAATVEQLTRRMELSDETIATMTDLPTSQVARLRRQIARAAVVGPSVDTRRRRDEPTRMRLGRDPTTKRP